MIFDFDNVSLERAKELILKYKKTKDKQCFEQILCIFDKYVCFLIDKFRKKYWVLKFESGQEMYSIAVIAIEKCLCTMPAHWHSDKIPLRLGTYIKDRLKSAYRYKMYEITNDISDKTFELRRNSGFYNRTNPEDLYHSYVDKCNVDDLVFSDILTEEERELIYLKYFKGWDNKELASLYNMSAISGGIIKKEKAIIEKLRLFLKEDV